MTWNETHRRWQALRAVEAAADDDLSGALPWRAEYAEIFGDRTGLVQALRYRWNLIVEAQLDPTRTDASPDKIWQELSARHAGLLRVLARADADAEKADTAPVPSHVIVDEREDAYAH